MSRTEGVVYVNINAFGKVLDERRVVLLFTRVETKVLQHDDLSVL